MISYRFRELLAQKERADGRRIPLRDVHAATGIKPSVLSSLGSPTRRVVTTTANVEALCQYFACSPNDLLVIDPPPGQAPSCHVDELYPDRRQSNRG